VTAVLDEAVLRRVYGGRQVLYDQLGLLVTTTRRPSIDVRVLPFNQERQVVVFGSFYIMEFAHDPSMIYIETPAGGLYESGGAVEEYERVFDHVLAVALNPEESIAAIERARAELV